MPCLWQSLATARPIPLAAPVIKAVLPALKTGCSGMIGLGGVDWIGALAGTNPPVELGANSVVGGDDNLS